MDLFPLVYQKHGKLDEDIHEINVGINVAATRCSALVLMERVLRQCDTDIITSNAISWMKSTLEIALLPYENTTVRLLSSKQFSDILRYSSQLSEISRDISSNYISWMFQELQQSNSDDAISTLYCFKAILKNFPGPCGPYKGKILKMTMTHITSLNSDIQQSAINCWCQIPTLGGGGVGGKLHAQQWEKQCGETLEMLDFIANALFFKDDRDDLKDPSSQSLSLPFPPPPHNEPYYSYSLIQRFITVSKCLVALCQTDNLFIPVATPLTRIILIVQSCCNITTKSLGHTSEKILRGSFIENIHESCIKLLETVIRSFPQTICQYSDIINNIFYNLLDLWQDPFPVHGKPRSHSDVRMTVYAAVSVWIQCCGVRSRFLCGPTHVMRSALKSLINDIQPTPDVIKINVSKASSRTKGKGRRKKNVSNLSETTSRIICEDANSAVCAEALKVVRLCIYAVGPQLQAFIHEELQKVVIVLLLQLLEGRKNIPPYARCPLPRKELYHLLLALTVSPMMSWPPPVQFACRFFQHGASQDQSFEIRSFCTEAGVMISNLLHPRSPSLHRISSDFANQCMQKARGAKKSLDVEDFDVEDEEESEAPQREDVGTTTDVVITVDETVQTDAVICDEISANDVTISSSTQQYLSSSSFDVKETKRKIETDVDEESRSVCSPKRQRIDETEYKGVEDSTINENHDSNQADDLSNTECKVKVQEDVSADLSSMLADFVDVSPNHADVDSK